VLDLAEEVSEDSADVAVAKRKNQLPRLPPLPVLRMSLLLPWLRLPNPLNATVV
jgi:hypothetical protein